MKNQAPTFKKMKHFGSLFAGAHINFDLPFQYNYSKSVL